MDSTFDTKETTIYEGTSQAVGFAEILYASLVGRGRFSLLPAEHVLMFLAVLWGTFINPTNPNTSYWAV